MGILKAIKDFFKPDPIYMDSLKGEFRAHQERLAFWVGIIAICLPIVLFISRKFGIEARDSISHYFYAPFVGTIFIISIAFIGTFLIAYKGKNYHESWLANIAGLLTFCIALFPTNDHGTQHISERVRLYAKLDGSGDGAIAKVPLPIQEAFKLSENSECIHIICAALFFLFLAFYSFAIFCQPEEGVSENNGQLTPIKLVRNRIYKLSGSMIILCISIIALHKSSIVEIPMWNENNYTFWLESLALFSFGFAWLVKGRFNDKWLKDKYN